MIVPMKKVTLYALKQDREALLESLQRSGELMVIATEDSVPQPGSAEAQQALQRTADTLSFIDRCAGKKGMFAQRPVVPGEALFSSDPQMEQIQQEAEQLEEGTAALTGQITSLRSQLDALAPWLPLDTPVEQLKNTRCAAVHTGVIPLSARAAVEEAAEAGGGDLTLLADGPEGTAAVLLCHKDDEEALMDAVKEAGFLEAGAYDNGEVVQEVGGGICQVSSTLYCATMYAQLETVERTNHYFKVDYLDYGLDATVSWPGPDFKFKNCRDYPIKIVATCDNEEKALTIEIWGTDVDGSYVTLRSSKLVVYDSVYVNTAVGYGVSAYRTVYDAEGNFLYEIEEPYGIYYRHDEDIQWPAEKYAADAGEGG